MESQIYPALTLYSSAHPPDILFAIPDSGGTERGSDNVIQILHHHMLVFLNSKMVLYLIANIVVWAKAKSRSTPLTC